MSTDEQRTLGEFVPADGLADDADETPAWAFTAAENNACLRCGGHVDADQRRVFGDDDNQMHACLSCAAMADLKRGAAANPDYDAWSYQEETYR